ncbi:hypothetical protein M9978_16415 [Sphingomonas sp. MG17]|uniref:Uncharacterized protein n=1 Tax=Sphingomonas tagetis TaxID=2949092 RepID=A0A9X2KMP1_9SPHN|nr:hypothetical protein [Sphingomonas tagetis]MCP3732010.1 hypothetical protein [Sphingomonas tagetis]
MIRTTKAPFAWPIPWGDGQAVFWLRAGDVIERSEFEAELAEYRAPRVFDFQLSEALMAGVAELLKDDPDDIERIREIAAALESGDDVDAADRALFSGVQEAVAQHWPAYRTLIGQAARRNELIPTLAFRRFCTGWEGDGLPLHQKGPDGLLTLAAMDKLEPLLIRLAGMRAYQALYATDDSGNSVLLSPPGANQQHSKPGQQKKAGSSAKRSGSKTRSPRSRKASLASSTSGSPAGA